MASELLVESRRRRLEESRVLRVEARLELLARHIPAEGWQNQARCLAMPAGVFFPEGSNYKRARDICAACPVRLSCLAEHLSERIGCFAGTSPRQRREIRGALKAHGLVPVHVSVETRRQDAAGTRRTAA